MNEVTVARFGTVAANDTSLQPPDWAEQLQHPDWPVRNVTAVQAEAYATRQQARLPTAGEWERAASGPNGERAATQPIAGAHVRGDGPAPSGPRATAAPTTDVSPEGVRHCGGNVAEWTSTREGAGRVVKGGAWLSSPSNTRPAAALVLPADHRHPALGFRLARELRR